MRGIEYRVATGECPRRAMFHGKERGSKEERKHTWPLVLEGSLKDIVSELDCLRGVVVRMSFVCCLNERENERRMRNVLGLYISLHLTTQIPRGFGKSTAT